MFVKTIWMWQAWKKSPPLPSSSRDSHNIMPSLSQPWEPGPTFSLLVCTSFCYFFPSFLFFFFFLVPVQVFGFSFSYERSRIKLFNRSNQAYVSFLRSWLNNPRFLESLSLSWMCPNESGSKCAQGRCWDTLLSPAF